MRNSGTILFSDGHLHDFLRRIEEAATSAVGQIEEGRLLGVPVDDLVAQFSEGFCVNALELIEDEITVDPQETALGINEVPDGAFRFRRNQGGTIPGFAFVYHVPFKGSAELLKLQPSSFTASPPRAQILQGKLVVAFKTESLEDANIKVEFERFLREVRNYVRSVNDGVNEHNTKIVSFVRRAIESRRERLLKAKNLAASLGYSLRERGDMPKTYTAPSVRRSVVQRPTQTVAPFKPEPTIAMEDYEHILKVMQNMAIVLERSPSAFKTLGEEHLRWHFVVQLNGQFEGAATGETFNVGGKTDILIREGGKNLFIAECKFWQGPQGFSETIDQLLGYVSWRDTKTAIILFNRDTKFSTVLSKIPEELKVHPNFKRELLLEGETRFRAVFSHKDDPDRELILTVLAFDVPS